MPLYGFDPRTPLEIHLDWQERVTVQEYPDAVNACFLWQREKRTWRGHLSVKGIPGNPMFPNWRDVRKDYDGQQNYYNQKEPKGEPHRTMYDRTFHIDYGYDPKKKRCDRDSYVGLDIGAEEVSRIVAVKSNTEYGRRQADIFKMEKPGYVAHYGHYNIIEKEIYNKSNLGIPIKIDDNQVVIHTESGLQTKNAW